MTIETRFGLEIGDALYREAWEDGLPRKWPGIDIETIERVARAEYDRLMARYQMTDESIKELCILTTRNESGQHFTEWAEHYEALEAAGMIEIRRPIHGATGIPCGQDQWQVDITDEGQAVVDGNPELHPTT